MGKTKYKAVEDRQGICWMARSPDRCGPPPSEMHERASRNLCSTRRNTKAENAFYLSSLRLQDGRAAISHLQARMAHFFALFLFLDLSFRRCINSRLMSEIFSGLSFTW